MYMIKKPSIAIFLFFSITIFIGLLKMIYVQLDYDQFVILLQSQNYNYNNVPLGLFLNNLTVLLIGPILEEFIFRSWLTKKNYYLKSVAFLMFIFIVIMLLAYNITFTNTIVELLSTNIFWYINFFQNLIPPISSSIFSSLASMVVLFFPLFYIFFILLNYFSKKITSKSFTLKLNQFLHNTSPLLLIGFNSIIFYLIHPYQFEFNFDTISNIIQTYNSTTVLIAGIIFSYVAFYYSLRLSILLHILFNFFAGIYLIKNELLIDNIIQYSIYSTIFTTILYLIYREIKLLKVESQAQIA